MPDYTNLFPDTDEPEIVDGMRPFVNAQAAFNIYSTDEEYVGLSCGWYDQSTDLRYGSFCYVQQDGVWADLLAGEVLRITHHRNSVLAYCIAELPGDSDLVLCRRVFKHLAPLARRNLTSLKVEVLR